MKRGEEKALSIGSNPDGGYLVPTETEAEINRMLTAISPIRSFHPVRFPLDVALGARGGPERLTDIVTLRAAPRSAMRAGPIRGAATMPAMA